MRVRYRIFFFAVGAWLFVASWYGCQSQAAEPAKSAKKIQTSDQSAANPAPTADSDIYIVAKGDTLYRIAQAEGTTVKTLRSLNGMRSNKIQIGQKLKIPISEKSRPAVKPAAPQKTLLVETSPQMSAPGETLDALVAADDANPEDDSLRARLVAAARELLGARYRWAGVSASTGFDCSGLVKKVFSYFDIDLPHSSKEQYKVGEKVDKNELEEGDLVFFSSGGKQPTHVGIYVGDNQFLHAARKAKGVVISDLNQSWYVKRFLGARRMIELWLDKLGSSKELETPAPAAP